MGAYAYLRKSSVHDPKREVSHEVQESAVQALGAKYGDDLTILSDWNRSGRLGANRRPGYRTLVDAIATGRCTAVYSYSLSRLGRSLAELSRLLDDCKARKIPVRLCVDNLDTSSASGMLLASVLGSVAQFEADVASERVLAANAQKRLEGKKVGTAKSWGEREGEDTEVILAAFREAGSFTGAAKLLNQRGVTPRSSKRGWWPSSVSLVVKRLDPTVGHRGGGRGVGAGGSDFAFARLLRCPTCGTRLTGTRDRDGSRVRYTCRLGPVLPHPRMSITEAHIAPVIKAEADLLTTPSAVEVTVATDSLRALSAKRDLVIDAYVDQVIDKVERDRRLAEIAYAEAKVDAAAQILDVPGNIDWSWDPKALNRILRAVFDEIDLDPLTFQPVSFSWRVPQWRGVDGMVETTRRSA